MRTAAVSVDGPVLAGQIAEVLERVVQRVLHRVGHELAEGGHRCPQPLVVLLPIDRMDDAGKVAVAQQQHVRAHPADLSGVIGEREDLEELLLEGLDSGVSRPMTAARKKKIYRQALEAP